jgi:hypothetical protein
MSIMMTIWKWPLFQTIFHGYLVREHLLMYNESHISDIDDGGVIGVKKK